MYEGKVEWGNPEISEVTAEAKGEGPIADLEVYLTEFIETAEKFHDSLVGMDYYIYDQLEIARKKLAELKENAKGHDE